MFFYLINKPPLVKKLLTKYVENPLKKWTLANISIHECEILSKYVGNNKNLLTMKGEAVHFYILREKSIQLLFIDQFVLRKASKY